MTGTYSINGTKIPLQPTEGRWIPREIIDISGSGHAIYPNLREFELHWEFISSHDFAHLQNWFESVSQTGTLVVSLPRYGDTTYEFYDYTGCVLREPQVGTFFEKYYSDVLLVVSNIRLLPAITS